MSTERKRNIPPRLKERLVGINPFALVFGTERKIAYINHGMTSVEQVDWAVWLQKMLSVMQRLFRFPVSAIWLQLYLARIKDHENRLKIIRQLQAAAPQCYYSETDATTFVTECEYLCAINKRLQQLSAQDKEVKPVYNDIVFDELTLLVTAITPAEMVALSQAIHEKVANISFIGNAFHDVFRIYKYMNRLLTTDICDFCKSIFIAENYRTDIMNGKMSIANIHTFNKELRNGCFEIYIQLRVQQILDSNILNNVCQGAPTERDAMEELYSEANISIGNMENVKKYKRLVDYKQQWYSGADDVLWMAKMFRNYLGVKIRRIPKPTETEQNLAEEGIAKQQHSLSIDTNYLPREGDYNGARIYAEALLKKNERFKEAWDQCTWQQKVNMLSELIGWEVDIQALKTNWNRNKAKAKKNGNQMKKNYL